jgi:hypothetical protein
VNCKSSKSNKQETKDYILYYSIYVTFQKRENYRDKEKMDGCQDLWVREENFLK